MTVVVRGTKAKAADEKLALKLFRGVGDAVAVHDEKLLDPVTGLSGSGPAYVYLFAEALIAGGIKAGLSPAVAERLTFQTLEGAVAMLKDTKQSPKELREMVTSPGGTTLAGLTPPRSGYLLQDRQCSSGGSHPSVPRTRTRLREEREADVYSRQSFTSSGQHSGLFTLALFLDLGHSYCPVLGQCRPIQSIVRFLSSVTDPVLYALRRLLPFPTTIGSVDLTPLLLMLFIQFLQIFLVQSLVDLSLAVR